MKWLHAKISGHAAVEIQHAPGAHESALGNVHCNYLFSLVDIVVVNGTVIVKQKRLYIRVWLTKPLFSQVNYASTVDKYCYGQLPIKK